MYTHIAAIMQYITPNTLMMFDRLPTTILSIFEAKSIFFTISMKEFDHRPLD